MITLTLQIGKVYPQIQPPKHCSFADVPHCIGALEDRSTPPSSICCNELKQHRPCLCFYQQGFPRNTYYVASACHIDFNDACEIVV